MLQIPFTKEEVTILCEVFVKPDGDRLSRYMDFNLNDTLYNESHYTGKTTSLF